MKTCSTCKIDKPEIEFYEDRRINGRRYCCKDCSTAYVKLWRLDNPENARATQLRRDYGMPMSDYQKLLVSQGGVCAICKRAGTRRALAVDHNHSTRKIRGLLCGKCNTALGLLQDSPEFLRAAADYIERHET